MRYSVIIQKQAKKKLLTLPIRVGDWRIVYAKDDHIKIISIEAIKSRGEVYK